MRNKTDASLLAGRINWVTRNPSPIITLKLKAGQIDKALGDKIKITLARAPHAEAGGFLNRVFEIVGKSFSCFPLYVELKGRDLMDCGSNIGYVVADDAPDYTAATTEEKAQSGYITDSNGYADPTDQASKNISRVW